MDWSGMDFPVSWGVGHAWLAASATRDGGPTGTSELCSALSPEVSLSDALTVQFLPFADTDLKGREILAAERKEIR